MDGFGVVLLVSDDDELRREVSEVLEQNDFEVRSVRRLDEAISAFEHARPGLVIMEQCLGRFDTLPRLREFRALTTSPIIMLTCAASEGERIVALELGADNCLQKPVSARELLARIRAYSRRSQPDGGNWRLNARERRLYAPDGMAVPLTATEFDVLICLVQARGEAVSRDVLSQAALRRPYRYEDRSLDNHVYQIRQKVRKAGGGDVILALRARGFAFIGFPEDKREG